MGKRKPLEGIRILDFTQVWAGPYCTMLFALYGAEVIKVESAKRPDNSRLFSVTLAIRYESKDESPLFNTLNLNKLDITLDLSKPRAVELAKETARHCDVVAENFRPGVMKRLGLDYDSLREVKPDIIYLSSSSRGGTGPEWDYAGYAPIFAALGGLSYITGNPEGIPSMITGRTDLIVGTSSLLAIMAALVYRRKEGIGQYIDVSSSEAITALLGDTFMDYAMNGRNRKRQGNRDDVMVPHACYRCKGEDKWISIAVAGDAEWQAFCSAIGNPEWTRESRFSDALLRKEHEADLDKFVSEWAEKRTVEEALRTLQAAGVAAMPSQSSEDLFNDPHLRQRGAFRETDHPVMGRQNIVGLPWRLSGVVDEPIRPAPLFGKDNAYVFGELLGMPPEEIEALKRDGVIY
ncbi:MAG: CoA transferase [Deltaproteobacteria bacterium]|nr:CoA transferase [Deltaproteobacteria bacterium]